jgi:hypothetical protein
VWVAHFVGSPFFEHLDEGGVNFKNLSYIAIIFNFQNFESISDVLEAKLRPGWS